MNKTTRSTQQIDQHAARELHLWAVNTFSLYGQFTAIARNLQRKHDAGTYDAAKAVKGWQYLIDAAAKDYTREFYSPGTRWSKAFNKATRIEAARQMEEAERAEIELGNYR